MLTDKQKRLLKAKHDADRKRERAAKRQKAQAREARRLRLLESEARAGVSGRRARSAERLTAYRTTPSGGVHGARSGKKDMGGPPENKAMSGPPENKEVIHEEWPLKCEPEWYLKRYPEGEHADLARRIVGL